MKIEIPDEFYSEFESLTNLIETIDISQNFKKPRELISHVLAARIDSNRRQTHESRGF